MGKHHHHIGFLEKVGEIGRIFLSLFAEKRDRHDDTTGVVFLPCSSFFSFFSGKGELAAVRAGGREGERETHPVRQTVTFDSRGKKRRKGE